MKFWMPRCHLRLHDKKQRIYPSPSNQLHMESLTLMDASTNELTSDPALSTMVLLDDGRSTKKSSDSTSNASSSSAERKVPAYFLHRYSVLGKGSFGEVCVASRGHVDEEERVQSSSKLVVAFRSIVGRRRRQEELACKCLAIRNDEPSRSVEMLHEVKMMRALQGHVNIIEFHDFFLENNELLIITELARGGTLFKLISTKPKHGVTEAYAAKTAAELLSAVSFMHSRGICHRDIKLENCVLQTKKNVWSPLKLIDFGLATPFDDGKKLTNWAGSVTYAAPEVFCKSYTNSCDVWSLGVVVYALLSGAPPFHGSTQKKLEEAIVEGRYKFKSAWFYGVGSDALDFVSRLMKHDASFRYTAEEALYHPWLTNKCDPTALDQARSIATVTKPPSLVVKQEQPQNQDIYADRSQNVWINRRRLYEKKNSAFRMDK